MANSPRSENVNAFPDSRCRTGSGIFMATRTIQRRRGFSEREYLANAIDLLKEAALQDLDPHDKRRANELLGRAGDSDLAQLLRRAYQEIDALPAREPSLLPRLISHLHSWSDEVVEAKWFGRVVIGVFAIQALLSVAEIASIVALGAAWRVAGSNEVVNRFASSTSGLSVVAWIAVVSTSASAVFVLLGIVSMPSSRVRAYRMFERSLFVSIFITQVFAFYEAEFAAAAGLAVNLPLLAGLQYMLARETVRSEMQAVTTRGV